MTNSYLRIKLQITSVVCDPYDPDSFVTVGVKHVRFWRIKKGTLSFRVSNFLWVDGRIQ